jgi:hypothetical protein
MMVVTELTNWSCLVGTLLSGQLTAGQTDV